CDEPFVAVLPSSHPLARHGRVEIAQLAQERFILHREGQNTRKIVDRFLFRNGISPRVPIELAETETIKRMVSQGLGVSILPVSAFMQRRSGDGLKIFPMPAEDLKRSLSVVFPKQKPLGPPAIAMVELLQKHFNHQNVMAARSRG
ncbi:MAG: LysR family transcriptional regulator substrate-binding protein, partial [Terriglobales bacterium]